MKAGVLKKIPSNNKVKESIFVSNQYLLQSGPKRDWRHEE